MRKYENFCNALSNMKDIYNYEEPYDNVVLTEISVLVEDFCSSIKPFGT